MVVALNGGQEDVPVVDRVSADSTHVLIRMLILEPVLSRFISAKHKNKPVVLDEGVSEDITAHIPSPIHRKVYQD